MHTHVKVDSVLAFIPPERDPETKKKKQFLWEVFPGSTSTEVGKEKCPQRVPFQASFPGYLVLHSPDSSEIYAGQSFQSYPSLMLFLCQLPSIISEGLLWGLGVCVNSLELPACH